MRFIGDVHGKFDHYEKLIEGVESSIQIGDLGVGFCTLDPQGVVQCPKPPYEAMKRAGSHRFIRGNHDNPTACRSESLWIEDGHIEGDMFFCGGALSASRAKRTEGLNWWPDEELSEAEFAAIRSAYLEMRPKLMVTHDCPHSIAEAVLKHHQVDKTVAQSRTRRTFQGMWGLHKPEIWIFGHWHLSMDRVIEGTRFICLDELKLIDI